MSETLRFLFRILSYLFRAYSALVIARVLLSWFLRGRSPYDNKITSVIAKLTDPYMNLFRNVKVLKTSRLDFSPILALIPLNVLQSICVMLATYGSITVPVVLALIIQSLWEYLFKFIFKFWLIIMGIRLVVGWLGNQNSSQIFSLLDPMVNFPVCWVWNLFFRKKETPDDKKLVLTAFIFYLILYFLMNTGLGWLINFLCRL